MSYGRNKAETEVLQFRLRELNEVAMMSELLNGNQDDQILQVESRHREDLARMQRLALDQQLELDHLMEEIVSQERQQEFMENEHRRQIDGMVAKIEEMSRTRADCSVATDGEDEHIRVEVGEQVDRLRGEFTANLGEVLEHAQKHLNRVKGDAKSGLDPIAQSILAMEEKITSYEKSIGDMNEDILGGKAVLGVKMVRDQLRFDKFVRTTKEKLRIFKTGQPVWGIELRRAKAANQLLLNLQKAIEDVCPLKGGEGLAEA
jgi:hypothetical protein